VTSENRMSPRWSAWGLRPIVLFVATYTLVNILHEGTHALTAYALHVPSTLFHVGVNLDQSRATANQLAVIGVSGPLLSLAFGLLCWGLYMRTRRSRPGLFFLYLAMFGTGTIFGNLISTSFVGDFSRAASTLQVPMAIRYAASIVGVLSLCGLSFLVGMELRRWAPVGAQSVKAMLGMIVLPVVVGTVIVLLSLLPMPTPLAVGRASEALFWIFGAVGALVSRKLPSGNSPDLSVGWADVALLLAALLAVRLMVPGIALTPPLG